VWPDALSSSALLRARGATVPRAGSRPVWNLRCDPLRSLASPLGGQERLRNVPIERDRASVFCGRGPILGVDLLVHGDKSVMIVAINPTPIAARPPLRSGHPQQMATAPSQLPPQGGA